MTSENNILRHVSTEPVFDIDDLASALQSLADLDRDSTACAMAMTAGGHGASTANATRAALDAADIAATAGRVLARGEGSDLGVIKSVVTAAALAADRCARECGAHAEHSEHCRIHSETASNTASLLWSLLGNWS